MKQFGILALLLTAACAPGIAARPPLKDAFYFPSGIWFQAFSPGKEGYLYVAGANYDKRYDSGAISAVKLSSVPGLPAVGAGDLVPVQLEDLGSDVSQVMIQSFAGEMAAYLTPSDAQGSPCFGSSNNPSPDCRIRLFVPTRAEGDLLEIVDALGSTMTCFHGGTNCIDPALSLTALENVGDGKPRAPEPIGVAVSSSGDDDVFVTHLKAADSPPKTNLLQETYVVDLSAINPVIAPSSFVSLGLTSLFGAGPSTSSVAIGSRYAYLSARYISASGTMIFVLDRQSKVTDPVTMRTSMTLYNPGLEASYLTLESRGVALGKNETRLYVAGRSPDSLVVANILPPSGGVPNLRVARAVSLPDGPNQVKVISRPPRGDLVVVTSSTAGVVSIYDDDVGRLVSQINGVGSQPFGIAVQPADPGGRYPNVARVFVSNFGDGRVAVIDVDVVQPEKSRLVAHLGKTQTCLLQENDASCLGTP